MEDGGISEAADKWQLHCQMRGEQDNTLAWGVLDFRYPVYAYIFLSCLMQISAHIRVKSVSAPSLIFIVIIVFFLVAIIITTDDLLGLLFDRL